MCEYKEIEFCGKIIRQRIEDGYLSATDMCKANGKRYNHWYSLDSTSEYLKELSRDIGLSVPNLIQIKKGGISTQQGSWVHPRAATLLAMWISPKFGVKVSRWIEEWRVLKDNDKIYLNSLASLEPSETSQKEKQIQEKLKSELNAESEIKTPVGYIDLETSDEIIEIKEIKNWKHAVGQILCYGMYINKQKCIYLFGDETDDTESIIMETCSKLDIAVVFIN